MFITRFAPIFFDADDGSGGGGDVDFDAARAEFLANPPAITDEPAPTPEPDVLDDPSLDALTQPAPAGDAPAEPATGAAPEGNDLSAFSQYSPEQIQQALNLDAAMRTESGIRLVVAQSLQALGYTPDQIRAALTGAPVPPGAITEPPPEPDPLVDVDDDDYVSGAQLKGIVSKAVAAAAEQATAAVRAELTPTVDAFQAQRQQQASATADGAYIEAIGAWPTEPEAQKEWQQEQLAIQNAAQAFIDPSDWNPASIRMAILRGAEALKAQRENDLARYVARKRAAREANPTNVGGGQPPGGEAESEPKSLAEAHERMVAEGYFR